MAADEAAEWITEICASANEQEIIAARVTALRMLESLLAWHEQPAAGMLQEAMVRACDRVTVAPYGEWRLRNYNRTVNG